MKFLRNFGQLTLGKYFLGSINGLLFASVLYFYMEAKYEKELFGTLASYVKSKTGILNNSEEDLLLQSLHLTYYLENNRTYVFNNQKVDDFMSSVINPVTYDLMTANGACGSYAFVLSRLLLELNINSRIAQMKVDNRFGGHILVEAETTKGWVVLDPIYNLCFKKKDSSLASFIEVGKNWDIYSRQVPPNYDFRYKYEGVRYTNWNKIPILMPLMKNILSIFIGKEKVANICVHSLFLQKFHVLYIVTSLIYLFFILFAKRKYIIRIKNSVFNPPESYPSIIKSDPGLTVEYSHKKSRSGVHTN